MSQKEELPSGAKGSEKENEFIVGKDPITVNLIRQIYSEVADRSQENLSSFEQSVKEKIENTYSDNKRNEFYLLNGLSDLLTQAFEVLDNNAESWATQKEELYSTIEKIVFLKARVDVFKNFFDNVENTVNASMQLDFSQKIPLSEIVSSEKQNILNYAALMLNMLMEAMANSVVSMKAVNTMLASVPGIAVIVTDKKGNIRFVSDSGESLLGVDHNSLLGSPIKDVFKNFSEIGKQIKRNKEKKDLKINVHIQSNYFGTIPAILSIPDSQQYGVEIEEMVYTLQLNNYGVKDPEFNVAREMHDKIGPLNTIMAATNLLKANIIDKNSKELLTAINNCALKLKEDAHINIRTMLNSNALESVELIDIDAVTNEVLQVLCLNEGYDEVHFVKEIQPVNFYCKRKLIYSILQNLISNTIKYRKIRKRRGKIQQNIVIIRFTELLPGKFLLEVKDSGIGIKKSDLSKIFDRSYRVTEGIEGYGMGLSLVYEIVSKLNGEIKVNSALGKGATFSIYFPDLRLRR